MHCELSIGPAHDQRGCPDMCDMGNLPKPCMENLRKEAGSTWQPESAFWRLLQECPLMNHVLTRHNSALHLVSPICYVLFWVMLLNIHYIFPLIICSFSKNKVSIVSQSHVDVTYEVCNKVLRIKFPY